MLCAKHITQRAYLYVDMDGVLAKWNKVANIAETHKPNYFYERELQDNLLDALEILSNEVEIRILSAVYQDDHSKNDKMRWLKKYDISFSPIFVPYGQNKKDYVEKSGFLLDDFSKNLFDWEKNSGFIGIKFRNEVNGNNGTWTGESVSYKSSAEDMAESLRRIIQCYTI